MTFGRGPRRGWTSTAQHLFVLARLYRDPVAQWMGEFIVRLYPQGLGNHGWMGLQVRAYFSGMGLGSPEGPTDWQIAATGLLDCRI